MCAIVGAFDFQQFLDLMELNSYRGAFSHSITCINKNTLKTKTYKNFGRFVPKENELDLSDQYYYIGHSQAPTGGLIKDYNRIHPAENTGAKLWHNGIVKTSDVRRLQEVLSTSENWDTALILDFLSKQKYDFKKALSDIDGGFACFLIKEKDSCFIFRNQPSPLFYDENLCISSTWFKNSKSLEANKVFRLDFNSKKIHEIDQFTSLSEPYYIEE